MNRTVTGIALCGAAALVAGAVWYFGGKKTETAILKAAVQPESKPVDIPTDAEMAEIDALLAEHKATYDIEGLSQRIHGTPEERSSAMDALSAAADEMTVIIGKLAARKGIDPTKAKRRIDSVFYISDYLRSKATKANA